MRCLLLLTTAWALAPISTPPKRTEFREGIGGATKEQAVAVGETVACAKQPIGPRDVVIRCYDISSDGKLAPALSLATSKRVHWFPKLTCAVGDRAWAYDGEIEPTSNTVVARAAGSPAGWKTNFTPRHRRDLDFHTDRQSSSSIWEIACMTTQG